MLLPRGADPSQEASVTTAAVIIIGDEILSGKVRDDNAPLLIARLREQGVALVRLVVVGDRLDDIADEVGRCAARCDAVITSGGIGPTHDDVTVAAVASALGRKVVRDRDLEVMVRTHWGERVNAAALRLADVPAGARLIWSRDNLLPLVAAANVYLLPGVPKLFVAKLPALLAELQGSIPSQASLFLRCDETSVAATLARVAAEEPAVNIGSYPRLGHGEYQVWVTVEASEAEPVHRTVARLVELIPDDDLVRVED
jgi:molybdenum cofactor synthesis domain-containing protein